MSVCFQLVLDFINLFFQLLYQHFESLNSLVVIRMLMAVPWLGHISSNELRSVAPLPVSLKHRRAGEREGF